MPPVYCFSVSGAAEPSLLNRALDVLGLYGEMPLQLLSRREGVNNEMVLIEAQMSDLSQDHAAVLARRLSRIIGVTKVLFSEKRRLDA